MLKIVAATFMLIDHIGMVFFPGHIFLRLIGRLAMPIFAYGIAIGFSKTSNLKKYLYRMGLFGVISQIPYTLMGTANLYGCTWRELIETYGIKSFFLEYNIGVTFLLALGVMYCYKKSKEDKMYYIGLGILIISALFINCDYGIYGVLMPLCFYVFYIKENNINKTTCGLLLLTILMFKWGISGIIIQLPSVAALSVISMIKDRPIPQLKYFFYFFYPGHMLLLICIQEILK